MLTVVRDQLNADRLRCINALTALVRSHDLGVDARRTLTAPQITTVAGWLRREESLGVATTRAEAVRLAKRILVLDEEPTDNRDQITELVTAQAPTGALNTIVRTRIRTDPDTRVYLERRRRCLKRYTSRQIFRTLAAAHRGPEVTEPAA